MVLLSLQKLVSLLVWNVFECPCIHLLLLVRFISRGMTCIFYTNNFVWQCSPLKVLSQGPVHVVRPSNVIF